MIDSGEVKDSNVSIMEKWNSNGYKEEGETKRQRLRAGEPNWTRRASTNVILQMQAIFLNLLINRSQISQRQFCLKPWTVSWQILLNPLDMLQVAPFLWISISQEQSEQKDHSRFGLGSKIVPAESWSPNTKNAPNASTAGKYHQIKAEIIIEHLWNPDERHRWERERWGDVRLQIFPTSLWEDLEKRKRKRETGEECTAQFRIR